MTEYNLGSWLAAIRRGDTMEPMRVYAFINSGVQIIWIKPGGEIVTEQMIDPPKAQG